MYNIEEEIRDALQAALTDADAILNNQTVALAGETVTSFLAQPAVPSRIIIQPVLNTADVAAGDVTITGTDKDDNVITDTLTFAENDTRALTSDMEFKTITQIEWPAQDGATSQWDVGYSRAKHYYLGFVPFNKLGTNSLPAIMVYGSETSLVSEQLGTARDKWRFTLNIRVVVNVYNYVNEDEQADDVLYAQKALKEIVESRDSNMRPIDESIFGVLRNNVTGLDYLYNNDVQAVYERENVDGTHLFYADITLAGITRLNTR